MTALLLLALGIAIGLLVPVVKNFGFRETFVWAWTIGLMLAALGFLSWFFFAALGFHPWRDNPVFSILVVVSVGAALFILCREWGLHKTLGWTWRITSSTGLIVVGGCVAMALNFLGFNNPPAIAPALPGNSFSQVEPATKTSGGVTGSVVAAVVAFVVVAFLAKKFANDIARERIEREAHQTNFRPIGTINPEASTRDLKDKGYND